MRAIFLTFLALLIPQATAKAEESFQVGWISALTGPVAKYGAHQSATLAVEEINRAGGVLGKPLELIMEDGRCDGRHSITAAKKLIEVDKVDFLLGGHCSTETVTIAPLAQQKKVLTLASISSSPDITHAGDYIFRTSPISTGQSVLLVEHMKELKSLAIIHEDTAYVTPIAESLAHKFLNIGGQVTSYDSFNPGSTDFRATLTKLKSSHPEALFIGVQAQDTALLILKQLRELRIDIPIYGNETTGNAVTVHPKHKQLFEGIIFAEVGFDMDKDKTKDFVSRFNKKFNTKTLPYGFWNADAYDGVMILAKAINECGPNKEKVRDCLAKLKDYPGVSGTISFDEFGDAKRSFVLKRVTNGELVAHY